MRSSSLVTGRWYRETGTNHGREHRRRAERQGLHPRVHRHHRAQPRQLHAPHDRQLEPDRAGRAPPALLRRVGRGRHHARLARSGEHLGGGRLRRARQLVRARVQPPDPPGPEAGQVVGGGGQLPPPRRRPRAGPRAVDADHRASCAPAGTSGETYAHEQVHVPQGTSRDFLEARRRGGDRRLRAASAGSSSARGRPRWSTSRSASCSGRSPRWEQWGEAEAAERTDAGSQRGEAAPTTSRARGTASCWSTLRSRRCAPAASRRATTGTRAGTRTRSPPRRVCRSLRTRCRRARCGSGRSRPPRVR